MILKSSVFVTSFVLVTVVHGQTQCNTGTLLCCKNVYSSYNPPLTTLLELLGIPATPANLDVGLTCSPVTLIGVGNGETW
ncbi:hypothetical protein BV22DRAFT_1036475 [Leucogyrophana mollusca]|uniref:Uncharacterized protein n=1 Tax=Leucogyrophana mollusca TaxID=85980 RepID=A0ACB8BD02_9AGAM|nr:hypothetical protein BV22DRAFT_1036475 [Leucogyrophana mollusca]